MQDGRWKAGLEQTSFNVSLHGSYTYCEEEVQTHTKLVNLTPKVQIKTSLIIFRFY